MKIGIVSDYKNIEFKNLLKEYIQSNGHTIIDKTLDDEKFDIIEATNCIIKSILCKEVDKAIIIDNYGTISFNIATKNKGIICAQVADEHSAKMTRDHNNTSIITIATNITTLEIAKKISQNFITSDYSAGRHQIRVDMLNKMA